ncbi:MULTISPECIES: ABC transporter ATP-binding protein [Nocardioides]|uniref:ABC transporter ATP-binding protein n=1 Tax=Nocardioides vastitatis TaxID=2568655 RepID=A0ABW0ZER3_9ACTN|nr:ABC transporter ATP-binding protein [Nocardioides sp.]THJ01965.1 ABC transporter ATP-binding protein [Nocardioides sp.]
MGAALTVRDVRVARGGREVLVVDHLDVKPSEHLFVLGPNGAGKTTLLRLLAAVTRPDRGEVEVDGVPVRRLGLAERRRVGYVTQRPALLGTTVLSNVELPLRWRKVPRARRRTMALGALERLQVAHLAERPALALSGGEQQRVNLARSLACDPDLLLLDEPAAGLDTEARAIFFADLERALADRAVTTVQVTHRPEEALRHADRVVVLVDGAVRQVGTPEMINRMPADAAVATVVGYDNVLTARITPDGAVLVGEWPTGLATDGLGPGPAVVAAFANAVQVGPSGREGLPAVVRGVSPGRGHRVVLLDGRLPGGLVPLVAHLGIDAPAPAPGEAVSVRFDDALSAILRGR